MWRGPLVFRFDILPANYALLSFYYFCAQRTLAHVFSFLLYRGDQWHKLREHDFSLVDGFAECSGSLQQLIANMMNKDPLARPTAENVYEHDVVARARVYMDSLLGELRAQGETRPEILFKASPLAGVDDSFLSDILGVYTDAGSIAMDCDA